jgi:hypothetical protein
MDEWKWIPGWEGLYQAHPTGHIRSVDRKVIDKNGKRTRLLRGVVLKPQLNGNGFHFQVGLARDAETIHHYVHDLIALTFIGPKPLGQESRHLNCDGFDNRIENLAYGTKSQNRQDSIKAGTIARGEKICSAKLTIEQVREIRIARSPGRLIAEQYGVTRRTIDRIRSGAAWAHVEGQPEMKGTA